MNRLTTLCILAFIVFTTHAKPLPSPEEPPLSTVYRLNKNMGTEIVVDSTELLNSTVEFDLLPQNSDAEIGVLMR